MQIEIKKVTLADFIDAAEARESSDGRDGLAMAVVMADIVIDGQEISDVPVHVGGNHINGGVSWQEAALVVWLDNQDGEDPHVALKAKLKEADPVDGKTLVEDALAADPRIVEIRERVRQEWRKVRG